MNWLRDILFHQYADIRREEWPRALLLFSYFFLIIATYWILKPLKRGLIINYFGDAPLRFFGTEFTGAEAEQFAKILNMIFAFVIVVVFTWASRRLARHQLVLLFSGACGVAFAFYGSVIDRPNDLVVWSFYVFGDMFNTIMVVLFWVFTNDVSAPDEARRTYGIIGLGGVIGGFVGATVVNASVKDFGRSPLLFFCLVPMALIIVIAHVVQRLSRRRGIAAGGPAVVPGTKEQASVALAGARLVWRSRYLLAIAGIVTCYELVSNIVDFQLAATVEREITASLEKDAFFGRIGQMIGIGSILVQVLLTSFVLRRFGVHTALMFLPLALVAGSMGFLAAPTLLFAGMMSVSDNALQYSIQQSAREALYTPTPPNVKYHAKAFIDMFVQRAAKAFSVLLNLVFAAVFLHGVRWLSAVALGVLAFWVLLVCYVGIGYRIRTEGTEVAEQCMMGRIQDALAGLWRTRTPTPAR